MRTFHIRSSAAVTRRSLQRRQLLDEFRDNPGDLERLPLAREDGLGIGARLRDPRGPVARPAVRLELQLRRAAGSQLVLATDRILGNLTLLRLLSHKTR